MIIFQYFTLFCLGIFIVVAARLRVLCSFTNNMNSVQHIDNETSLSEAMKPCVESPEEEKKASKLLQQLEQGGFNYISYLIQQDNMDTMGTLLSLRKDIVVMESRDGYKSTPLLQCCKEGSLNMLKLLLHHGSDVNQRDRYGLTVLH